jgi:predicted nucleic acid-binding protein
MKTPLLDTNILVLHLMQNHPEHSPRATAFLERVEAGEVRVRLSDLALFETIFTLQRRMAVPKQEIRDRIFQILDLPGLVMPGKDRWRLALNNFVVRRLSMADAYQVVLMGRLHTSEIISFDKDFDRIPGITRIEP